MMLAARAVPFAPIPLQDHHHYYETVRPCGVHWYSMTCGYCPLARLPYHHSDRFSRSTQGPESRSRRLYAGCRSDKLQDPSDLVPGTDLYPGFDIVYLFRHVFDGSLSFDFDDSHLTGYFPAFSQLANHHAS